MSETEATNSVPDNNEESSVDADVPKLESDKDAEKEELKTPDESTTTEPEDKSASSNKEVEAKEEEEEEKGKVKVEEDKKKKESSNPPSTKPTPTSSDQTKSGECNLLPVLVERLRSALELSCSSQSSEDPLPLEDSGIDSEEDLRMWASGLCNTIEQNNQSPKPLDLKFLEDLLLSDIQTALSRLQDTLKRVDVNTLTKYNSTLDSTNKLHLLRLISNLLSKLKIPEELTAAASDADKSENSEKTSIVQGSQKRRRANRHTIGVSAEEIAHARRLLDEQNLGGIISPEIKIEVKPTSIVEPEVFLTEGKPASESIFNKTGITQAANQLPQTEMKTFEQVRDKHVKDAINQQQTYYNKNKEFHKENVYYHPPLTENNPENVNRADVPFKDDNFTSVDDANEAVPNFYQQAIPSKYNKFVAKKSKIKRANTIDIPNYLKLQADNFGQNHAIALRRPIDIGDRNSANNTNIIPAFKPKTDNDRKFLALINKNNDAAPSNSNLPFKSFNYRQTTNIDKNWNSRFSNIKTTFDKPSTNFITNEEVKGHADPSRRSQSRASDSGESDGVVVGSLRLSYNPPPPKQKQGGFTHAPTSPFQKIEKPSIRNENASIFKSGYLPKGGNSLQAKVKIFNQENSQPPNSIVAQNKNKFNKISDNSQYGNPLDNKPGKLNQHGSFSYNPTPKQNSDSNKNDSKQENTLRSYLPGNRNVVSSKLIVNPNANEEVTPKVKTQYPYLGYSRDTGKSKNEKIPSNEEQNSLYSQFQNANSSYQEKSYAGYNQPKNVDVPARTSSHSFMLQKIANDNNYESKPKANRYVNEALKIKDNKELTRSSHQPVNSHYVKPLNPTIENYSANNVSIQNHSVQNKHTMPAQNYPTKNEVSHNSNKSLLHEYGNPPKTKIDLEYKPLQTYSTQDANIRVNNISNQMNTTQDIKVPLIRAGNTTQNYTPSYDGVPVRYSTHQTNDDLQLYDIPSQRNPPQDAKPPLIDPRSFSKPFDASNERYSSYPMNDCSDRIIFNQENLLEDKKLPSQINSITGKIQSELIPNLAKNHPAISKQESNYIPYESYQTKMDSSSSNDHLKNYQESNYYGSNTAGCLQNDRLQSYDGSSGLCNEPASQNQTVRYNPRESNLPYFEENHHSDKEVRGMYEGESEPVPSSTFDLYRQKDMLMEDENIQNQDISSEGIVTRYQCAIATVATTPESSEADINEVSFPNPKLYNLKIAAYPTTTAVNDQSNMINASYAGYNQNKISVKCAEPEKELIDESADAFEEIQRHNLLQQQIIQKLQNEGNSGKDIRRKSLEKFKWEDKKSPNEIPDRRSSYYEKFKGDDRSPTSPLPQFPFNRTSTPPKQTEEPVIECNNTLEKINIFEEKSLQPLPSSTRQRFRPLSIPKFDKSKEFKPPKINVVTPSKIVKPKIEDGHNQGVISSSTNNCDSSDEYLMSCANRQSRSIVLSKSESWHQLALNRGNLQPTLQPVTNHLLKPPKPKSPASLKLSKQYEASSSSDNMKRMEEKIQRYFHSPTNIPTMESSCCINNNGSKRESKSKRNFSSRKHINHQSSGSGSGSSSGLARSHTMPHLYDEKLLIDDNTDVEKAFDSLFKEATKADNNRY